VEHLDSLERVRIAVSLDQVVTADIQVHLERLPLAGQAVTADRLDTLLSLELVDIQLILELVVQADIQLTADSLERVATQLTLD